VIVRVGWALICDFGLWAADHEEYRGRVSNGFIMFSVTAIVFLSPTEANLVRQGRLDEPSFRPHPSSKEWFFGDPDDYETEIGEEAEGAEDGGDGKSQPVDHLEQPSMAHHWKRHPYDRALLLAHSFISNDPSIIGVSVAAGGPRSGRRNGVRRLLIGPWALLDEPVRFSEVIEGIPARAAVDMRRILGDGNSRPLPEALSVAVNDFLRTRIANYDQLLTSLPDRPAPIMQRLENPAVVDANLTALRLFSRNWRSLEPVAAGPPSGFAISIELAAKGNENDYITDDSTYFLDWDRSRMSRLGWWEFRKGDRRLHLKNINVSPAENTTGADLVYVRRDPDAVVLVQYKLLELLKRGGEAVFRPDGRLKNQIDRMLSFCPTSVERGVGEENARVGGDFGFVKFIVPVDGDSSILDSPPGRYYPADAVRRMLENPDTGPHGGSVHYVYQRRHLDSETFSKLVRDRWIGSTGPVTDLLMEILGLRPREERQPITLAIEEFL
jgi:hypothetical protein